MASARSGMSAARISPAGRCIISKARPSIRTASMRRRRAVGSGRSSSAPMMAAKPGNAGVAGQSGWYAKARATSSSTRRVGTHKWYDGTQHPWEFKRIWHLEPSLTDPDTVYAGAEDAAIFKTVDGGKTWKELPGLRSAKGHLWQPGAGGMAVAHDPSRSARMRTGSSSPSRRRALSAPTTAAKHGSPSIAA